MKEDFVDFKPLWVDKKIKSQFKINSEGIIKDYRGDIVYPCVLIDNRHYDVRLLKNLWLTMNGEAKFEEEFTH